MTSALLSDDCHSFTGVAETNISGGAWLKAGSYTSTVTAGTSAQYNYQKVKLGTSASGLECVGLALYDVASGTSNEVAFLRCGVGIFPVTANVNAGQAVSPSTFDAVGPTASTLEHGQIGRALTEAASGGYSIIAFCI